MQRFSCPSLLSRSFTRISASAGVVRSNTKISVPKRHLNTEKPLFFSASKTHARDEKKKVDSEMLAKISASMQNKATPTIITAEGIDPSPLSASAAAAAASGGNKVFTDKALLEEYINFGGHVRHGKIMEDLDALAGAISYKHCDDGKANSEPIIIVTAAVDRIDFWKPFGVRDLRLLGYVTYVGYSSMEVFMKMEEIPENPGEPAETILAARFTTVAKYALTHKAAQVNPLRLQNDAEKKLFQISEDHKTRKRIAAESALTKRPPTEDERFLIHDLYLEYSKYDDPKATKPDDLEWMSDTKMSSIQIMQPQDRNIHDKIFGGYLMRLAYELAFCNTSVFIKCRPTFLALDEISFRAPVNIGTLLALDSQIVYSEGGEHHSLQVRVKADVLDIQKNTRETTNTFWFTFEDPQKDRLTPKIMPRTYAESMLYIEGMRRRKEGAKLAQINRANLGL
ncbi:hypothetical protein BGX27_000533 [Mortierella sp. AM989]|nr:hypothetical protein BGX27_000533 [Mortierella sp. AM989]